MRAKKQKIHVLSLNLPIDCVKYIDRLAKASGLTSSKIANVILWMQMFRMEASGELDIKKKKNRGKQA